MLGNVPISAKRMVVSGKRSAIGLALYGIKLPSSAPPPKFASMFSALSQCLTPLPPMSSCLVWLCFSSASRYKRSRTFDGNSEETIAPDRTAALMTLSFLSRTNQSYMEKLMLMKIKVLATTHAMIVGNFLRYDASNSAVG